MICGAAFVDVAFRKEVWPWLRSPPQRQELVFTHKGIRQYLWLRGQFKPSLLYFSLFGLNSQPQNEGGVLQSSWALGSCQQQCNEIEDLCAKGQVENAVNLLFHHDLHKSIPLVNVYGSLLKACARRKALGQVKRIHAHMVLHQLESNTFLGETLVSTLAKCGALDDALQIFNRLPHRTVFAWTALIAGCVTAGNGLEALRMYQTMIDEGLVPDKYTFVSVLKASGIAPNIDQGRRIHAEVLRSRFGHDLYIGTSLVDMYARCGSLMDAQYVFDGLHQRDVVTWNVMLAAYCTHGQPERALQLYGQMLEGGASPDIRTYVSIFQACSMLAEKDEGILLDGQWTKPKSMEQGKAIHAKAWSRGYCSDVFVGSTLVSFYGKCGSIVDAQIVFNALSDENVVSWNAMITAYTSTNQPDKTLHFYELLLQDGVSPDERTFATVVQACGLCAETEDDVRVAELLVKVECVSKGKAVHAQAWERGLRSDVFVASTLVSMYGKCGSIVDAQNVFSGLDHRDVVSWTAVVAAYVEQGEAAKSLDLYAQMLDEGVSPNDRTYVSVLQACGMLAEEEEDVYVLGHVMKAKSLEMVKAIHAQTRRRQNKMDIFVGNTLINVYGKCGSILDAQQVFCLYPFRDIVSCNAMLAAYISVGLPDEALQLYRQMHVQGINADEITLVCILQACSHTGNSDVCAEIHRNLMLTENKPSLVLANSLIHTYARCATMEMAQTVFDAMIKPNVVSWTTLIAGYSRQGNWGKSLECYEDMQEAGVKPNGITFLSLLHACSHAAAVNKGLEYFNAMVNLSIAPQIEHYVSLVDILGRAGLFAWIQDLLFRMPEQPNLSLWLCLLGACRKHGNVSLAEHAFRCAIKLQPTNAAAYVLMSNIYSHAGMWKHANQVNAQEQETGTWKKPGHSWIQYDQDLHLFTVGETKHPLADKLHDMLVQVNSSLTPETKFARWSQEDNPWF